MTLVIIGRSDKIVHNMPQELVEDISEMYHELKVFIEKAINKTVNGMLSDSYLSIHLKLQPNHR